MTIESLGATVAPTSPAAKPTAKPAAPAPTTGTPQEAARLPVDQAAFSEPTDSSAVAASDYGELPWEEVNQKPASEDEDLLGDMVDQEAALKTRIDAMESKAEDAIETRNDARARRKKLVRAIKRMNAAGNWMGARELAARAREVAGMAKKAHSEAGKLQRILEVEAVNGATRAVDQFFKTSCAAVEGMAAWARKDPDAFDAALKSLEETGECQLPGGETLTLPPELSAEVKAVMDPNATPRQVQQALMQAVLMKKVNPDWNLDSDNGVTAVDVREMATLMNAGLFLPQALVNGEQMSDTALKKELKQMFKAYGTVSIVLGTGDLQHAFAIQQTSKGKFTVLDGNQPRLDADGNIIELSFKDLKNALATGELNVGGSRVLRASTGGSGSV